MKKVFLTIALMAAVLLIVGQAMAAPRPNSKKGMYWVSSIAELQTLDPTGAGAPNTYDLIDGDAAILVSLSGVTTDMSIYIFDASSTEAESSPDIIRPTNYTTGVWLMSKVTVTELASRPSATPGWLFEDLDGAGSDQEAAKILVNMSATGDGVEVSDAAFTFMNAGTRQNFFIWDGSEFTFTLGPQTDGWSGGDVANYEQIRFDFDTANDGEIGISSPSGATRLLINGMALDAGTGYTYTNTDVDVTINTGYNSHVYIYNHASAVNYTLPAEPETASGTSKIFCIRSRIAQVVTITPATGDVIELDGADETAAEAINNDDAEAIGDFICLEGWDDGTTDRWATWGQSGSWNGATD